ncbi:MAG: EI24 domain-containing protein [Alphaproteobacteria bacterium]|nr:EI24 domain-containing protein [Alphaproteobacteria bacterium]
MLRTLPLAIAQVAHPSSRRVLLLSIVATLALLVALVFGVGWLLAGVAWFGIGWLDSTLSWLGTASAVVLAWLLLPGVLAAMTAMLVDPVADAVEQRYYPGLPQPRPGALADGIRSGLKLALIAIVLNLVLLPLYLVPGLNLVLFYGLNGYLVARGYFEQVAVRRLTLAEARAVFARHRMTLWLSGILLTFVTTVPFLNFVVPILATAWMTHATQELRAR